MIASADVRVGDVSGLLLRPDGARLLYVLAHGAGAGMRHPFLEVVAQRLAERSIATLRYQFPYMEQRGRRPDPPARSEEHTSELQSRSDLVCRLLLEKKKKSSTSRTPGL